MTSASFTPYQHLHFYTVGAPTLTKESKSVFSTLAPSKNMETEELVPMIRHGNS